jgi:septal ring factor EnvC (AmiA/AmiB activator)
MTSAVSRRPSTTAAKLKNLEKKIGLTRRRIDELERRISNVGTKIGELNGVKQQLETTVRNVATIRADVNSLLPYERDSGTRASTLGPISEEGRLPIDRNAVKDAGSLLNKT